jgi:putative thiamine transport system substrate-binding protein
LEFSLFSSQVKNRRRQILVSGASLVGAGVSVPNVSAQNGTSIASPAAWAATESAARGQTVYLNAWGGSARVNDYLQWVAAELLQRFGITLNHVKLTDTVEAVKRVRGEKESGKRVGGSIDMMWINGENFLTMKREAMLFGPFAEALPSFAGVDVAGKPTTRIDFSEPTEGFEAPWGMAQLTFYADAKRVAKMPMSTTALAEFAKANPGRVTYPRPPAFLGTTFLKQALVETLADRSALYKPFTQAAFDATTPGLWRYLDALHPHLWRQGKQFPVNPAAMRQMLADGELMIGMTFNPNEAANEVTAKRLPETMQSWQFTGGTIGNTHFLAIPFNAKAPDAAKVAINFMLSPLAQSRKADIRIWGDPTVLAVDRLNAEDRARFATAPLPGQLTQTQNVIAEPHGSWVDPIEREWAKRYAA